MDPPPTNPPAPVPAPGPAPVPAAVPAPGRTPPLALAVATWFGAGLSPRAPGTVGSLASLVLWAPLVLFESAWWVRLLVALAVFAVGTLAAQAIVKSKGAEDPQIVVVDEVAGMGCTLLFAANGWASLALGFALFRLFDIWKPWPVRWADRKVKGGFGVMLDDVLAGLYALACLMALERWVVPAVMG
jgi:phosphatidylglycerophosphatase A